MIAHPTEHSVHVPSRALSISAIAPRLRALVVLALEAFILVQVGTLLVVVATGGFDWGWLRVRGAARPLVLLVFAIAVRAAIPGWPGLLLGLTNSSWYQRLARLRHLVQVPPAVADALLILLVTRPATIGVAFLSNLLFIDRQTRAFSMPFRAEKFAEIFAAWDSGWYFDIARRGYYFSPEGQSSIAFFPLYPMLMRLAAAPFGGSDRAIWIAGVVISMSAFTVALVLLHQFAERVLGTREAARRTILYLAVFPFSFFMTRVYTEALFFALTMVAIAAAHDGRWWRAGLAGALTSLTRPNGVLIAVPLLCFALADRPDLRTLARRLVPISLVPLGLVLFCGYVYLLAGNPLAWLDAQRYWFYSIGHAPWEQLVKVLSTIERYGIYDFFFTSRQAAYQLIHATVAVVFLLLIPKVFTRLGVPLGSYALVSLMVPLTGSDLQGMGRYMTVVFPVFMLLGNVRSARVHEGILVVSVGFRALFLALFVNWYPIF